MKALDNKGFMIKNAQVKYNSTIVDQQDMVLKKISCLVVIFIFILSRSGFSDELLNLSSNRAFGLADSHKLGSDVTNLNQTNWDLIGFGSSKTWQIHPAFDFQTTYDSNINREPPGQRHDDLILRYIPSIEILRKGSELEILTGYEMNFEEYLRDSGRLGAQSLD